MSRDNDSDNEDLPPWLAKEFEDADYIPVPEHKNEVKVKSAWSRENERSNKNFKSLSTYNDSVLNELSEKSNLMMKIKELERTNQSLMLKVEEQEERIKSLKKQNLIYAESNRKLLELSNKSN